MYVRPSTYTADIFTARQVVFVLAEGLFENVTDNFPVAIDVSFAKLAAFADTLVSCVSPRGDDTGNPDTNCPYESVRTLLDEARAELDSQLVDAREGFQDYIDAFEEYETLAANAYDNMIVFYEGASSLLKSTKVSITGLAWAELTAADFFIQSVNVPSITGVLTGYADVMTAAEIWDQITAAYTDFQDSLERVGDNISTLAEAWDTVATEILSDISITFSLDDYDPPHYAGASTPSDSNAAISATATEFNTSASLFGAAELALLDALGPRAANRSLPASLSLNHTFQVCVWSYVKDIQRVACRREGIRGGEGGGSRCCRQFCFSYTPQEKNIHSRVVLLLGP